MTLARDTLRAVFGYSDFRPGQGEIVDHVIAGGSGLAVMPTGAGKSMCYQLPALVREGTGIVVSPLIALMQDQVAGLVANGVSAAFLNSTLDRSDAYAIEQQFLRGELDLLYLAPERIMNPRTLDLLGRGSIALLAIDEAHCVSQWGHDFRPEYLQLSELAGRFPETPRLALTATADPRTQQEIMARLGFNDNGGSLFVSGFDRPNIRYLVRERKNPKAQLLAFVRRHSGESGIVYAATRKRVEEFAAYLVEKGVNALPYHAGLPDDTRHENQRRFQADDAVVIVATVAFGMGVDKPDVRFVAHINLPKSIEAYYQETGRAGRDGEPAEAWMAFGLQDLVLLRRFIDESDAPLEQKRLEHERLNTLVNFCESSDCRRRSLLRYFGDPHDGQCGNCDNCISPAETFDATTAAQKALSCIYRTGQQFGVGHLVDVLLGKETEKVERFRHRGLSTFGIGAELSASEWKRLFRQLIAAGFCDVDSQRYNAIALNARSRDLLRGETTFHARKEARPAKKEPTRRRRTVANGSSEPTAAFTLRKPLGPVGAISEGEARELLDEALFDALREWRTALASKRGVPPYVIFSNRVLKHLAAHKPLSSEELLETPGIGQAKLTQFGPAVLELIRQHST